MLRLAFDFIITWRETRTRPNAYLLPGLIYRFTLVMKLFHKDDETSSLEC